MIILIIAALATICVIAYIAKGKKETVQPRVEEQEAPVEIAETPAPEPVEKVESSETTQEMEDRLKSLGNPDSEKPFAKISKPEISDVTEVPTTSAKKRAPKKKVETEVPVEKVEKRQYKKRTPKQ